MSQTIKTYADLIEEKERMRILLIVQKERIKENWEELKLELLPVKNAFDLVGKMTSPEKSNPLVNVGLKLASDLFLKNFVLAKAGWAMKLAVPFVVKNYSSHLFVEKGTSLIAQKGSILLNKIGNFFKSKSKIEPTDCN